MKYSSYCCAIIACCLAFSAQALTVPPILEMGPLTKRITVPVTNNGSMTATYRVSIDEITFPDSHLRTLVKNTSDIMFYPAQLTVAPKETVNLIMTRANSWQQERYFSVKLTQSPGGRLLTPTKATEIEYPVALGINLMTRAKNMQFAYHINKSDFFNDGNSYVMLMRDGQCGAKIGDTYFIPPHKSIRIPHLGNQDILRLGKYDALVNIIDNCHKHTGFWQRLFG